MKEFYINAIKPLLWEIPLLIVFCILMVLITGKPTQAWTTTPQPADCPSMSFDEYKSYWQAFEGSPFDEEKYTSFVFGCDNQNRATVWYSNTAITFLYNPDNQEYFMRVAPSTGQQSGYSTFNSSGSFVAGSVFNNSFDVYGLNSAKQTQNITLSPSFTENGGQLAGDAKYLRPNIVAEVNGKSLAIRSKFSPLVGVQDYKIYWFITNANIDGEGPEVPFSLDGYGNPDQYLTFEVPEYGTYNISAYFKANDGSELPNPEGLILAETSINVLIDGSIYAVDSDDMECNTNNFCEEVIPEWIPEECIVNEFPWVKLDGCIRNALHYIGQALGLTRTKQNPMGSPFVAFQSTTFGLTSVISAPIQILSNISNSQYGCSPITLPLPHLNRSMILPCLTNMYQTSFTTLFTMYQSIVGGVISYYVMTRILELVKMMKDPKNDKIEVLKL